MKKVKIFTGKNLEKDVNKWLTVMGADLLVIIEVTQTTTFGTTTMSVLFEYNNAL